MAEILPVTIVIPTYRREGVLLETLQLLLELKFVATEVIVLDQTERHETVTDRELRALHDAGRIRWLRLPEPSIPRAMNRGLLEARENIVLFLDDDIRPEPELVAAHHAAHQEHFDALIAGRVIQPWEEGRNFSSGGGFRFAGLEPAWIEEFMGGNFSVRRTAALAVGGFDENFVRVAYRFEAEFACRFIKAGNRIRFDPRACLHHLKATSGGTRSFGDHLRTGEPGHAVGAYYFAMRTQPVSGWLRTFFTRPFRAVATRHHLRAPWWIPVTLFAELCGVAWAIKLAVAGPRYANPEAIP